MKVIADTNVIIDFWKRPTDELIHFFEVEDVVICGVIAAELLHGAVSEKNLEDISTLIVEFEFLTVDGSDWMNLGKMLYTLRTNGLTVPFQDAVIAYTAIKYDVPVRTNDRHFSLIKAVLPGLQLYD
ncbi:MAG: PIN domain-containing protein [Eubacterium sp.]|nr:PIN domain-containing protein [Eubacterium sp.]